ncbi:hypothetical protein PS1_009028 [Malus domestica]
MDLTPVGRMHLQIQTTRICYLRTSSCTLAANTARSRLFSSDFAAASNSEKGAYSRNTSASSVLPLNKLTLQKIIKLRGQQLQHNA